MESPSGVCNSRLPKAPQHYQRCLRYPSRSTPSLKDPIIALAAAHYLRVAVETSKSSYMWYYRREKTPEPSKAGSPPDTRADGGVAEAFRAKRASAACPGVPLLQLPKVGWNSTAASLTRRAQQKCTQPKPCAKVLTSVGHAPAG